ncbi:MAG: hypothetical protein WAX89_00465 [Alphaproteobacteria bacterium]
MLFLNYTGMNALSSLGLAAALMLTLGACVPAPKPMVSRPSKLTTEHPFTFGAWTVQHCRLVQSGGDIWLDTGGDMSTDKLRLTLHSTDPLMGMPALSFSTMAEVPVPEGRGRHFGFDMTYTPATVANISDSYAHLMVTYQKQDSRTILQHYFPLAGLPEGLAYLEDNCSGWW